MTERGRGECGREVSKDMEGEGNGSPEAMLLNNRF